MCFFSKPYQLGPVTSFLVDRLPPLYLRMCFQKHHPTGGGHCWLRASTKEWLFGSVHNWELQNPWSWASWQEATKNRPLGGGWWWWWWWLRWLVGWLVGWWFYDLGWPNYTIFFWWCLFFIWLVRMVFATLNGCQMLGKCAKGWHQKSYTSMRVPGIKPTQHRLRHRRSGDSSNGSVCPTCFPRLNQLEPTGEWWGGADAGGKKQTWLDINVSWNTFFCQIAKMKATVDGRDPAPPGLEKTFKKKHVR